MGEPPPHSEIITGGRDEALIDVVRREARRHPRRAVALSAVIGVLLFAAAGLVAVRTFGDEALPTLAVDAGRVADPWQAGWGGRPRDTVVLATTVTVRRLGSSDAPVRVVGIDGPGATGSDALAIAPPGVVVPVGGVRRPEPVQVPLRTSIDCSAVPPIVPDAAYGLRLDVGTGSRHRLVVVPAGDAAASWAHAVQLGCATYTARRDLTISTISARVDPATPRLDATVTVVNGGRRPATVSVEPTAFPQVIASGGFPLQIPAGATVTVPLGLRLDRCDVVGSVLYSAVGTPVLSSQINLVAASGPLPQSNPSFDSPGPGTAPTGVVLAPAAGQALGAALAQACSGVEPVASLIPAGGIRYDSVSRDLSITALIDVTPGKVSSFTLQPDTTAGDDVLAAHPAWTTTGDLRPDATGQTRVTLRYRVPASGPCSAIGATLLALVATLQVPGRVIRYSLYLDLAQDTQAVGQLCSSR